MKKIKLSHKLLALFLAFIMVFTALPVSIYAAENDAPENDVPEQVSEELLGEVTAITESATAEVINDDGTTTVEFKDAITLQWAQADVNLGRGKDGWWVGVKLTAPQLEKSVLEQATYQSLAYGASEPVTGKEFWKNKDSADDDSTHYITLWAFVNEESLNKAAAAGESIETSWTFDWNNDETPDQTVIVKVDPSVVTLEKDGGQVYPTTAALGTVEAVTGNPDIDSSKPNSITVTYNSTVTLDWAQADTQIGIEKDGWWVGIKVTAPADADLENAKFKAQSSDANSFKDYKDNNTNYITLWSYVDQDMLDNADGEIDKMWMFDWNADGTYEQQVKVVLDPSKVELDYTNYYAMDEVPPSVELDGNTVKDDVDWATGTVTISGTAKDEGTDGKYISGIKEIYYVEGEYSNVADIPSTADKKEITLTNDEFTFDITDEGEITYTIFCVDNNGNYSEVKKVYTKIDNTDPDIKNVLVGADDEALKATQTQTVTFTATDAHSGIEKVEVTRGSDTFEATLTDEENGEYSFEATENGTYTIVATDAVGHTKESPVTIDNIDKAAPEASLEINNDNAVTFLSKLESIIKRLLKIKDGKTEIDKTATLTVYDVKSDGEADKYSGIAEAYYLVLNKQGDDVVHAPESITAEDVKKGTPIEDLGDGSYKVDFSFEAGQNIVFVVAYDLAGNELFAWSSDAYAFEETPSTITVSGITNGATDIKFNKDKAPDFKITVQDQADPDVFASGIEEVKITVNGKDKVITFTGDPTVELAQEYFVDVLDLSKPGIYDVTITATDVCGNESTFTFTYKYDDIAPEVSDLTYADGDGVWSQSDSVTFKVTDQYTDENGDPTAADVTEVQYRVAKDDSAKLTDAAWETATGNNGVFTVDPTYVDEGEYTLYVEVQYADDCGNEAEPNISSVDIKRDRSVPVIGDATVDIEPYDYQGEYDVYSKDLTVTIPVNDQADLSGLNKVTGTVNVNGTETVFDFDVYTELGEQVETVSVVYDAAEGTVKLVVNDVEIDSVSVTPLDEIDKNEVVLTIDATDNAGNPAVTKTTDPYYIDFKAPVINSIVSNAVNYTTDSVEYDFKVEDLHIDASGAITFKGTFNGKPFETSDEESVVTFTEEGLYEIESVVVTDKLGNETPVDLEKFDCLSTFVIDKTAPTIKSVQLKKESGLDIFFDLLLKVGVFANEAVVVTVEIENTSEVDAQYTAPLNLDSAKLNLKWNDQITAFDLKPADNYSELSDSWELTCTLPLKSIGNLSIIAEDKATNSTNDTAINSDGIDLKFDDKSFNSKFFLSEDSAPVITMTNDTESAEVIRDNIANDPANSGVTVIAESGKVWVNNDVIIPIKVKDEGVDGDDLISGLYQVTITVNEGTDNEKVFINTYNNYSNPDDYLNNKVLSTPDGFAVDTSDCTIGADGAYHIKVEAVDLAQNEADPVELTIYKDTETPYVEFAFSGTGYQDSLNEEGKVEIVEENGQVYGYYFKNDTIVTITATDKNNDMPAVGVKSITYALFDLGDVLYKSGTEEVGEDGKIEVTIEKDFKGQIFAYATDKLGNNFSTEDVVIDETVQEKLVEKEVDGSVANYVTPDKTIVEHAAKHKEVSSVTIEPVTTTTQKDASGLALYNGNVKVKVTITDTYSGIRNGKVVVTSDENSTNENDLEFTIDNLGNGADGWSIDGRDGNLVTKISKTITITRNSNNITVSASMEDRAGNTSKGTPARFSIDTQRPEITVRYNNNSASDGKYFKANRTATITVTERNFDPSLVTAKLNGKALSLNWSGSNYNTNTNKEGTKYTATISYNTDGDYKFDISCKDLAGNADYSPSKYTGQTAPTDFVIDKTAPVVTVTNTSAATPQNGNYYSKPVQVTITVVEHNWDPSKFIITYAENDRITGKSLSWSNSGDTHTATFSCDSVTGLKYTIDYALTDKAANNAVFIQNGARVSDYRPDEFYVDQTIPEIQFTGALEGSHNKGTIESGVILSDTYYDRVEVTLTGKRRGVVFEQTYTDTTINITEFIETTRDKDDYYTVSVVAYDKAGNSNAVPATRSYCVNRNGSMFVLSDAAKKLNEGKNSQNVVTSNIIIYEYNVDHTPSQVVELWKNGNVTKLSMSRGEYTVSTIENQNGYVCNTYSINARLFEDDAAYRVYITTVDEAGTTSTNTSEKFAAISSLDKNDGSAPVLSFIKDTKAPEITDINLDPSKANKNNNYYSINQDSYVVTFKVIDEGSGFDPDSVFVTYVDRNGETVTLIPVKNEDGSYSIELKGRYDNLSFIIVDNAGNEFSELVFNRITVSSNFFVRLINNTPLFIGLIVAFVAIAILIIILIAKRRKDEEEETENA